MNTFGDKFRLTLIGGSHTPALSVEIEGVPAGISLTEEDFMRDIVRRKGGGLGKTPRVENDMPRVIRGIESGRTTGTTVKLSFDNNNIRIDDYAAFRAVPRPGHADYTRKIKYGTESLSEGAGMFSGRMTLPIVAAGVIAKKIISPISVQAYLTEVGGVKLPKELAQEGFLSNDIIRLLEKTTADGDSLGGVVECVCENVPAGLGEPFFASVESEIARLAFSIPGVRGIEFGDGFEASRRLGSQHNDAICDSTGSTFTNGCGGVNGGITNGNSIVFRIAFKPTSSIAKEQHSFNFSSGRMESFRVGGRHDVCFALRTPVVVESIAAIYFADQQQSR